MISASFLFIICCWLTIDIFELACDKKKFTPAQIKANLITYCLFLFIFAVAGIYGV